MDDNYKITAVEENLWAVTETPACCHTWKKIAPTFEWFIYNGNKEYAVMPCYAAAGRLWRINVCPGCGQPARERVIRSERTDNLHYWDPSARQWDREKDGSE